MSGIIGNVIYLTRGSLTMNIKMLAVARGIGHQRLLQVTNQGHLKRYIDLTVKCDQCMGNGCCIVSSSIISHWAHDVIATLNQRHWS